MGKTPVAIVLLGLLTLAPAKAEDRASTAKAEALSLVSSDVETAWRAARALVERPGRENTAVRLALAALVDEAALSFEMPRLLRHKERGPLIDRVRQAILLARLERQDIVIPEGMIAIPGGVAARPLTHEAVVVPDFFLDRLETTRENFARFLAASKHPATGEGFLEGWKDGKFPSGTGIWPVTDVNRDDATAFATWRKARLPTAQEWTLARGGCDRRGYPWGVYPKAGLANVLDGKGSGRPEGVDGRPDGATPLGLLRLAGNVAEWTSSPWGPAKDVGVIAGESFLAVPQFTRVIVRRTRPTTRKRDLGFRCAASIPTR